MARTQEVKKHANLYGGMQAESKHYRVGFYIRVSTDGEDQLNSYENQKEACKIVLRQHPEYELVKIFQDEGITGTLAKKRPGFLEMIQAAKNNQLDLIISKSLSRFSRNTMESLYFIRSLMDMGVHFIFEREGIDTRNQYSEFALTLYAAFAQEESRSISENTKMGIRMNYQLGEARWCPIYGYGKGYVPEPEQARVVRELFKKYEMGQSLGEIADSLNQAGIPTARNGKWRRCQIQTILKNSKYAGDLLMQKYYTKDHLSHLVVRNDGSELPIYSVNNHHKAIVDREQFDREQRILEMRQYNSGRYPFGESLHCPYCKGPLTQTHTIVGNRRPLCWNCQTEGCQGFLIFSDVAERAVCNAVGLLDMKQIRGSLSQMKGEERKVAKAMIELRWEGKPQKLSYYIIDKMIERIEFGNHDGDEDSEMTIYWRFGGCSTVPTLSDSPRKLAQRALEREGKNAEARQSRADAKKKKGEPGQAGVSGKKKKGVTSRDGAYDKKKKGESGQDGVSGKKGESKRNRVDDKKKKGVSRQDGVSSKKGESGRGEVNAKKKGEPRHDGAEAKKKSGVPRRNRVDVEKSGEKAREIKM